MTLMGYRGAALVAQEHQKSVASSIQTILGGKTFLPLNLPDTSSIESHLGVHEHPQTQWDAIEAHHITEPRAITRIDDVPLPRDPRRTLVERTTMITTGGVMIIRREGNQVEMITDVSTLRPRYPLPCLPLYVHVLFRYHRQLNHHCRHRLPLPPRHHFCQINVFRPRLNPRLRNFV